MGSIGKFFGLAIIITFLFVSISFVEQDLETNYIDTGISNIPKLNDTNIAGTNVSYTDFNKFDEINQSVGPILDQFQDLGNNDGGGFFSNIGDLAIAIPKAVISLPSVAITMFGVVTDYITYVALIFGIQQEILAIALLGLMTFITIALVSFWRRHST